jgi:Cof subfamily protein (haloacid dehalogenase superfamily)
VTARSLDSHRSTSLTAPKVVAADLDGTLLPLLLDGTQSLTALTIAATRILTRMGIRTILVTGRMFHSAVSFAQDLDLDSPIAAYQGALIREVATGRLLHHDPVPLRLTREVLDYLEPYGCSVNLYINDQLCVASRTEEVERYERLSGMKANVVGPLISYVRRPSTKIGASGDPLVLDELLVRLRADFAGRLIALKTWPFFLEIASPTATKARALQILGRRLGFEAREVLAFGDSYNDADMLAWAGTGVAMEGAPPEVLAVADATCESVEEDGFARYLMREPWFPSELLDDYA